MGPRGVCPQPQNNKSRNAAPPNRRRKGVGGGWSSDGPPRNLSTLQVLRDSYGGLSLDRVDIYPKSNW